MSRNSLKNVARLLDGQIKTVPVEESFLNDLKRSIEITDEKSWRKPSQTLKPSSMQCKRNSYFQIVGEETDKGQAVYNSVGICEAGSDIHVRLQTAIMGMKANGIDCEWIDIEKFIKTRKLDDLEIKSKTDTETKLYHKKYNMSFMCDGIIRYKGHYYIIEIKSETSNKWYSREGVDSKHKHQAISYSVCFGINQVIFLYRSRDNLELKAYMFNVTDDMKQEIYSYISDVQKYVESKTVPPKEEIDRRVCQYCSYQTVCKRS